MVQVTISFFLAACQCYFINSYIPRLMDSWGILYLWYWKSFFKFWLILTTESLHETKTNQAWNQPPKNKQTKKSETKTEQKPNSFSSALNSGLWVCTKISMSCPWGCICFINFKEINRLTSLRAQPLETSSGTSYSTQFLPILTLTDQCPPIHMLIRYSWCVLLSPSPSTSNGLPSQGLFTYWHFKIPSPIKVITL